MPGPDEGSAGAEHSNAQAQILPGEAGSNQPQDTSELRCIPHFVANNLGVGFGWCAVSMFLFWIGGKLARLDAEVDMKSGFSMSSIVSTIPRDPVIPSQVRYHWILLEPT